MKTLSFVIGKKILSLAEFGAISSVLSFIVLIIDKYIFNDWEFIAMLTVLIALDTLLGFYVAFIKKEVSSDKFAKLFTKIIVYMVMLICSHSATHVRANGSEIIVLAWLDSVIYSGIVVREILSLFEKCAIIQPNLIPKWIINRLKQYNETGIDAPTN
jgi:phage-related holin